MLRRLYHHKAIKTIKTSAAQQINVGSTQTMSIANTQSITATGHSTFNNNLTITGTTHSVGDVSTAAGNAPTLATHKHRQIGGTADDGDGPTKTKETTVADEGAP